MEGKLNLYEIPNEVTACGLPKFKVIVEVAGCEDDCDNFYHHVHGLLKECDGYEEKEDK